jgi:hypothetical protein
MALQAKITRDVCDGGGEVAMGLRIIVVPCQKSN